MKRPKVGNDWINLFPAFVSLSMIRSVGDDFQPDEKRIAWLWCAGSSVRVSFGVGLSPSSIRRKRAPSLSGTIAAVNMMPGVTWSRIRPSW